MSNGWTYYESREAAEEADARRSGRTVDFWTNSPSKAWLDSNGDPWVLTFVAESRELMLFRQDGANVAWVSPAWASQTEAEQVLGGYETARGNWAWLTGRLAKPR